MSRAFPLLVLDLVLAFARMLLRIRWLNSRICRWLLSVDRRLVALQPLLR